MPRAGNLDRDVERGAIWRALARHSPTVACIPEPQNHAGYIKGAPQRGRTADAPDLGQLGIGTLTGAPASLLFPVAAVFHAAPLPTMGLARIDEVHVTV